MSRNYYILKLWSVVFILNSLLLFSQKKSYNDFSAIIHEEAINKVLESVGEISGKNNFEVLLIKGHYTWRITNSQIHLNVDSSDFTCDAKVEVGPFKYKTEVTGNVKIGYDNANNLISIKISRAIFELYTMLFNKKVHIKDIHLEDYFKDPFVFEGPKSMATNMTLMMPDSTIKTIYVQPTACVMKVMKQMIITSCEIIASNQPITQIIKVIPPIQETSIDKKLMTK